ncbi:MAG: hypothetical protein JST84_26885 [Acidobacteria bacterium]|nr:hypothetical protein [Acidobacteriota bacterium]
MKFPTSVVTFLLLALVYLALPAHAQKRDHLTEKEVDWVREVQVIDKRIEVFIKAADRRILVLVNPDAKQPKKEEEKWGPLPTGTKAELLEDYKHILEEAEEKLDDAYSRNDNLIAKALSKFKEAARKHLEQLRSLESKMTETKELRALAEAIEEAETVTKGEAK